MLLLCSSFFVLVAAPPASGCENSGRGKVGCEGEEEQEGEDNGDKDGSDSDGNDQNAPEPRKGETWDEVRYVECISFEDDYQEGYCRSTEADSCPDGENYYWVDVRVWTYDGSQWTYDESVGEDGWEVDALANGCYDPEEVEQESEEVTEDVVIRAFNSRALPSGEIGANPPNGRTLVNLDTIFYTDQGREEFALPLHEINRVVQIIATPTSYNWDFGPDEASFDTKGHQYERGVPMSQYNTHTYTETGTFDVTLTIDYEVQFNDGNGWQTISQPITSQPSDPHQLQVLEKRNRLSDGN